MVRVPACHAGRCGFESRPDRQVLYSYRLSVRTPGFHPGKRSSILLSCTNLSRVVIVILWSHKPRWNRERYPSPQPNNSSVAQLVEYMTVNHGVAGSSPARGATTMEGNAAGMVLRLALKTRSCLIAGGVRLFCLPPVNYGELAER